VESFVKSDIRTTGKVMEFLMSLVETNWFVQIDSDIVLTSGWYDEMCKHKKEFDVMENSRRILAYHFYREDKIKLQPNVRSLDFCHLMKKSAIENFHCDDDYMVRFTDFFLRQIVENSGHRYGKISTTQHIHHETERIQYESDKEKNFVEVRFTEPEIIISDHEKYELFRKKHAKAVIKYLDPEFYMVKDDKTYDDYMPLLDRKWVEENGPKWLTRYDRVLSKSSVLKKSIRKQLKKFKPI